MPDRPRLLSWSSHTTGTLLHHQQQQLTGAWQPGLAAYMPVQHSSLPLAFLRRNSGCAGCAVPDYLPHSLSPPLPRPLPQQQL